MRSLRLLALLATGCTTAVLVPGPNARTVPGESTVAYAESQGVRLWIDGAAWRSDPLDLGNTLTPIKVVLENDSGHSLRLSWRDMTLTGAGGFRYRALAPMPGDEDQAKPTSALPLGGEVVAAAGHGGVTIRVRPPAPRFHHHRFFVARPYVRLYPGFPVWPRLFFYDPYYYAGYSWRPGLPTDDMLAEALPEGVAETGGNVQGFVYFPRVTGRETLVQFQLQLIDADDGKAFGSITVPLRGD